MTDSESNKIIKLQTQMENIENKVNEGFSRNEAANNRIEKKLDEFIEKSEKVYAAKWVEDGAKWALGLVVSAVFLALLALVVKS